MSGTGTGSGGGGVISPFGSGGSGTVTSVTAADGSVVVGGTAAAPTVRAVPWWLANEPAGTLAARYPGCQIASSALASFNLTGQVAVAGIGLPKSLTVSNLSLLFGSTGASGATHFWMALLDSTLHVLAVSADGGAASQPQNTFKTVAVTIDGTNPYVVSATGLYYVAASSSASTTAPTASGITAGGAVTGITPAVCGTAGTQAAPPAVGAQLNGGTVTFSTAMNFNAWVS